MCLKCHSQLSTEEIIKQLQSSLLDPQYEKWNSTSINHCIIAAYGFNGNEASGIAVLILQNFHTYLQTNYSTYKTIFERNGFNVCPTPDEIKLLIEHIQKVNLLNKDKPITQIHEEILNLDPIYNLPIEFKFKMSSSLQPMPLKSRYLRIRFICLVCGFMGGMLLGYMSRILGY